MKQKHVRDGPRINVTKRANIRVLTATLSRSVLDFSVFSCDHEINLTTSDRREGVSVPPYPSYVGFAGNWTRLNIVNDAKARRTTRDLTVGTIERSRQETSQIDRSSAEAYDEEEFFWGIADVKRIRILVVDDHAIVRAGLRLLLEKLSYVGALMEASNGREAIELVASQRPDIVLMDISLSELNGLESTARLAKEFPQTRVIILSAHSSPDFITKALRAGASGYVLKESAPAELDMAITAAMAGGSYLSPTVSAAVINDYVRKAPDEGEPLGALTPRQREILQLIAEGRSTKDIAYVLKVSVKTVETHRSQIMDRLEIRDVPGLVRFAIRTGLVSLEA